jgi:hypothetical protein
MKWSDLGSFQSPEVRETKSKKSAKLMISILATYKQKFFKKKHC